MPGTRARTRSWIVICAFATVAMTALSTTAATAAPAHRDTHVVIAAAKAHSAAGQYWTPERMRKATPVRPRHHRLQAGRWHTAESSRTAAGVRVPPVNPPTTDPEATESAVVGQVFFHNPVATADFPAGDHFCTGAAVNSASRSLVITAAECVHGGKGGDWYQNWIFIPGFEWVIIGESQPYGIFGARLLGAPADWVLNSNPAADFAMVQTEPNSNGRLVDVAGGMGLEYGDPIPQQVGVIGYTWECLGFSCVEDQTLCSGSPQDGGQSLMTLACGGGYEEDTTGAPWVTAFDGQLGDVNGNVTLIQDDGTVSSPYYGASVYDLYQDMSS